MPRANALQIHWHHENAPVYSVHFQSHGKGRFATGGGDNNIRIWNAEVTESGAPKINYLATLSRHTQAVNVVRFSPRGDALASAGDDGNVLVWVPSEMRETSLNTATDNPEPDKENWRCKLMCRSMGSEIYDLAWSPDSNYILTGSMDNIARIYDARDGQMVRQIAEHNHYVQGVSWDPLNEYIATQSSDRSVHIYSLLNKDGQFVLSQHGRSSRMEYPQRRLSQSPAPDNRNVEQPLSALSPGSSAVSAPGTPNSHSVQMNPPTTVPHSRRSSFTGSPSLSARGRTPSPSPSVPLPAIKPFENQKSNTTKSTSIYHNETLISFFRRLAFAPDGSLLVTPAGLFRSPSDDKQEQTSNTVYIYTRAGLNKAPVANLPGHRKPSIAVKWSPCFYKLRSFAKNTQNLAIDTSTSNSLDELPPSLNPEIRNDSANEVESQSVFALPYRMVYAVATQDTVYIYDTQQKAPLCCVSNLHYATFTDLSWSHEGDVLMMTSTDGFCSSLIFDKDELGEQYTTRLGMPSSSPHSHPHLRVTAREPSPLPSESGLSASSSVHMPTPVSASSANNIASTKDASSIHQTLRPTPSEGGADTVTSTHIPGGTGSKRASEASPGEDTNENNNGSAPKKKRVAPTLVDNKGEY